MIVKRFVVLLAFLAITAGPAISDWKEEEPEFVFARLQCSNRNSWDIWPRYFPDNPPWHHDYPYSDEFLLGMLRELTEVHATPTAYKIVQLSSPEIFNYPFIYFSEPGFMVLDDQEVKNLGEYIRRGGFILADDFRTANYLHGPEELEVLRMYLKRALPERELVRLDIRNPIFHTFYDIDTLQMDPPYGGDTPGFIPQFWGMADERGNIQLIADYNNDIGEFWKWVDMGKMPFRPAKRSVELGIDYVIYSMTH